MRIVEKPWGYEKIWAESPNYLGKILVIDPGHKLSRQYHNQKEETFMVLKGQLTLEIGCSTNLIALTLNEGESYHCAPGTIHRMINDLEQNSEPIEILEVSTAHPDDIVRLEDDYNR